MYKDPEKNRVYAKSYMKKYRKENPQKVKGFKLRQKYGMTIHEFNEIMSKQRGVCAICKSSPATCVDHCHTTNRVRGLLCSNCNTGIGMLKDDTEFLANAIKYLQNT